MRDRDAWTVKAALCAVMLPASAHAQDADDAPPPDTDGQRIVRIDEYYPQRPAQLRIDAPRFIQSRQILSRTDAAASQRQTLAPDASERLRYNAEAYALLNTRMERVPSETVEVEQSPDYPDGRRRIYREAARDRLGRKIYAVDWDAVQRDWGAQIETAGREEMIVGAESVQRAPLRLSPVVRNMEPAAMSDIALPVLAPGFAAARTRPGGDPRSEEGMLMFSRGDSYTASLHMEDVLISVSGSRVANIEEPDAARAAGLRALAGSDQIVISPIRGGQELLFNRYGVAYSVLILCENPQENALCADPETAAAVARSLMLVGGAPGTSGGGR